MGPKQCNVCGRKLKKKEDAILCSLCSAVQLCSVQCSDHASNDLSPHGHSTWCSRMRQYMQAEDQLAHVPFTFSKLTTSTEFTDDTYAKFLKDTGVYGCGFWRHEAGFWMNHENSKLTFGELPDDSCGYMLPVESCILEDDFEHSDHTVDHTITDWASYYKARGLRLDSPVAILLQYVMTLYHVWSSCLPLDCCVREEGVLTVGILGAEKECDMLPTFLELARLRKDCTINLHIFGPEITSKIDGHNLHHGNMTIHVHRSLLHQYAGDTVFDFVLGFNAGLGAYVSWAETLKKLKDEKVPAYFTDYCHYSCEVCRQAVEGLGIGTISPVEINPFRSPVRQYSKDHNMPTYSNGFLFHLMYAT